MTTITIRYAHSDARFRNVYINHASGCAGKAYGSRDDENISRTDSHLSIRQYVARLIETGFEDFELGGGVVADTNLVQDLLPSLINQSIAIIVYFIRGWIWSVWQSR